MEQVVKYGGEKQATQKPQMAVIGIYDEVFPKKRSKYAVGIFGMKQCQIGYYENECKKYAWYYEFVEFSDGEVCETVVFFEKESGMEEIQRHSEMLKHTDDMFVVKRNFAVIQYDENDANAFHQVDIFDSLFSLWGGVII